MIGTLYVHKWATEVDDQTRIAEGFGDRAFAHLGSLPVEAFGELAPYAKLLIEVAYPTDCR